MAGTGREDALKPGGLLCVTQGGNTPPFSLPQAYECTVVAVSCKVLSAFISLSLSLSLSLSYPPPFLLPSPSLSVTLSLRRHIKHLST